MSVYREKEHSLRQEKKSRDSSTSGKSKPAQSVDKRPIITQEKPTTSRLSLKEKGKTHTEKTAVDKSHRRKTENHEDHKKEKKVVEKERKTSKPDVKIKRYESVESRIGKVNKLDEIYLKALLEKKGIRKSESGSSAKESLKEKHVEVKRRENGDRKPASRRDRTRTRTLSPTEIKQLIKTPAGVKDSNAETEKREDEMKKEEDVGGGDEEYEDDFEDYDSDFEEDEPDPQETLMNTTFVVSEKEGSPPNVVEAPATPSNDKPEVQNQWKVNFDKKEIQEVKASIEKENYKLLDRRKSISKMHENDSDKENTSFKMSGSGLIDFSLASKKQKKMRKAAESRKRAEELLSMITLDTISYSILEIPPIPYDEFMKTFGKTNTKQVHVQTNEDDIAEEEVQTDEILLCTKWTQHPPEYLGSRKTGNEVSYILTKEERLGVGGDVPEKAEVFVQPKTNALWNFLSWASQLVLVVLEKKNGNFLSLDNMPNHSKAMAFGDGFVNLNVVGVPFLTGRSVTNLCILPTNVGRLLSVHTNKEKLFQKCMICIWSFRELSKPLKVLLASNRVSSSCFGLNQGSLVFAGLTDGSICLWDLREPSTFHNRTVNSPDLSLQSPTYTTAGNLKEKGHSGPVVAVRLLTKVEVSSNFGDFTPMQICSLDENGTIIIWTVVQLEKAQRTAPSDDLGLAHWGRVKLVKSSLFCVFASLKDEIPGLYITCNDIIINEAEDDGFYVANSFGSVHHCSSYGSPMKPKYYVPSKQDAIIETTCLELCPFNGNYFLVGCGDGTIRLHSRHQENPLICLNSNVAGNEKEASIVSLSWMRMRPCVFFALDSLSRINIWDLGASDMYPEISLVLTEKKITCMRLLPISNPRQVPFIVIGTEGGSIEIHKLKKEYGCRTVHEVHNEMKMFLKYVSIL